MAEYLFILGREPSVSLAELEARGPDWGMELLDVHPEATLVRTAAALPAGALERLGGSVKLAEVIACLPPAKTVDQVLDQSVSAEWVAQQFPTGRIEFGLSLYAASIRERGIATGHVLRLKKELKKLQRPVRVVTSKEPHLSAVTVVRQGLLKHGQEFILFRGQQFDVLARTVAVQDYQAYSLRDFGRPEVDPKSGMVPPKLAQMMLNIAQAKPTDVLLDPFCGSGTVLQEAALLGVHEIHGSDSAKRAVTSAQANMRWLLKEFSQLKTQVDITLRDARQPQVKPTVIVTEPDLGRPQHGNERTNVLTGELKRLEQLYLDAFQKWATVLPAGARVVMIWPEFLVEGQRRGLQLEQSLQNLGFQIQPLLSETTAAKLNIRDRTVVTYSRPEAKVRRQIRKWIFHPIK